MPSQLNLLSGYSRRKENKTENDNYNWLNEWIEWLIYYLLWAIKLFADDCSGHW